MIAHIVPTSIHFRYDQCSIRTGLFFNAASENSLSIESIDRALSISSIIIWNGVPTARLNVWLNVWLITRRGARQCRKIEIDSGTML